MGHGAAAEGMTIQYCMSHVRHILQSVEVPAVTNARASGDYHPVWSQTDADLPL
jgi:copper chaperone CopZ